MHKVPLSVVIITHNEEAVLEPAIRSIAWANEIVVVDSGSTDTTTTIATDLGVKVYTNTFENYGKQKKFAVSKTKNNWVFILDADERVSKKLSTSIINTLQNPANSAYYVQRKNYFLGKEVKAEYWNNDRVVRLFDKTKHTISQQKIHEKVVSERSETGTLDGVLHHLSHRSIDELSKKAYIYSKLDAEERLTQNPPTITGWNIVSSAFKYFFEIYILGGGYKDGTEGLLNALILTYQQRILIRSLIWEKQQNPSLESKYQSIEKKLANDRYAS